MYVILEIRQKKHQLESTVGQWRDYKEEYERLSDWLQQIEIHIKAQKTALLSNVQEKQKQVKEVAVSFHTNYLLIQQINYILIT